MSIRVMTHVWADESIQDPYERLLLLALADFSNDKGESFPSVDTLATKCCLTSRGVIKVLERLEENGKLSKKLGGGRGKSNLYTIILPQQDPFKKGEPYSVNPVQGKRNPERHSVNGVPETLNGVPKNGLNPEPGSPEPLKKNHQETTTTPRAHAKEALPVSEEPSSSLFCAVASPREEVLAAGHLTEADRQRLDQIAEGFGLDSRQQVKTQALAKRQGIGYVLEQADIVRNKANIKNLAGALERALDTPGGWKRPKRASKPERKAKVPAQSEPSAEWEEDFSAELYLWQQAGPERRAMWFADPALAVMKMPKDGQLPSKMFLRILRFVLGEEQHNEAAVTLATGCASGVKVGLAA